MGAEIIHCQNSRWHNVSLGVEDELREAYLMTSLYVEEVHDCLFTFSRLSSHTVNDGNYQKRLLMELELLDMEEDLLDTSLENRS